MYKPHIRYKREGFADVWRYGWDILDGGHAIILDDVRCKFRVLYDTDGHGINSIECCSRAQAWRCFGILLGI